MRVRLTDEQLSKALTDRSFRSLTSVMKFLGYHPGSGSISWKFRKFAEDRNLDISHLNGGQGWRKGKRNHNLEHFLVLNGPRIKNERLKAKLFESETKQNHCEICCVSDWMGKPITLQLHHVNGNNRDNRLENIQILCPNCHSQTDNFCGRNGGTNRTRTG